MDIDSIQVLLLDYFRIRSFSANDCRADLISWSALTMLQWNFGTFSGMLNEKSLRWKRLNRNPPTDVLMHSFDSSALSTGARRIGWRPSNVIIGMHLQSSLLWTGLILATSVGFLRWDAIPLENVDNSASETWTWTRVQFCSVVYSTGEGLLYNYLGSGKNLRELSNIRCTCQQFPVCRHDCNENAFETRFCKTAGSFQSRHTIDVRLNESIKQSINCCWQIFG